MTRELVIEGPGKNALGTATMGRILEQLEAAAGAPVLLTGAGDAFSAGLDLREVATLDASRGESFLRLLERCMSALYLYPGPIVAAVNGHAIAGGCIVALCCDYRVATVSPGVKIGMNEVPLGLRFPPRTLSIVRARVPRQHRDRVVLGGRLFAPSEALRAGLVDEVDADPVTVARARLEELAVSPGRAYAQAKADLRGASEQALASDDAVERWLRESLASWTSPELKSKIAAVLRR
jgi:enoyl-CoA hydratase/carnithine racemase